LNLPHIERSIRKTKFFREYEEIKSKKEEILGYLNKKGESE
jgi:hypothetical protein